MNAKIQRLPDAELAVMQVVWEARGETTSSYIMGRLEGKRDWGATTVLNLLSRLIDRGFLTSRKENRINIYMALIDEEHYLQSESRSFLERLHGNSVKSLVASLYDSHSINQNDLDELKRFIDEKTQTAAETGSFDKGGAL